MNSAKARVRAICLAMLLNLGAVEYAMGYSFNELVPDVRQAVNLSGGSACPVASHQLSSAGSIAVRWSTALSTTPTTIITQNQTASGRLTEIEQTIQQSLGVWAGVSGSALTPASFASLTRSATQNTCGVDGVNSICFDQADAAFTPGVLAFTRVVTADRIGAQAGSGAPSIEVGQILDADIYFNPSNSQTTFATPTALGTNPGSYDLESLLTHELGHFLGFSHSAVWSAMMFPFAPAPGTFSGERPTAARPDLPLAEDDRTGLRVLYPDAADSAHSGAIRGRIVPANALSLPLSPPGVSGVYGAHVVAVDEATGGVIAGVLGGWSCMAPGPAVFDGSYRIERLPIGRGYQVYAEPLNGAVDPSEVSNATASVCRNAATDAGWPPLEACVVPTVVTEFTTRARPGS